MRSKFKRILSTGIVAAFCVSCVSGCANQIQLAKEADAASQQAQESINANLGEMQNVPKPVHPGAVFNVKNKSYVDLKPIRIPAKWKTKQVDIYASDQSVAAIVAEMTKGMDVTNIFEPEVRNQSISVAYHGNLYDGLKQIARDNNIDLNISGNVNHPVFNWSKYETRTFQIAFLPGNTSFGIGNYSKDGGSSSSDSSDDSGKTAISNGSNSGASLSGSSLSVWKDLTSSVKGMLSPHGKLSVSQASSSITVIDTPYVVNKIAKYIDNYNGILSKRVAIKVKILEVQLDNNHANGIDWNAVYSSFGAKFKLNGAFGKSVASNFAKAVSSGIGIDVGRGPWKDTSVMIQALDQQGKTTVVNEPTVVSLNNQPNTISVGENQAYVKKTDVTLDTQTHTMSTAYTPGNIKTGLDLTIIPHIQDNKIYLSLNAILSTLQSIKTFGGDGTDQDKNLSQVQLPQTEDRVFNQRIMSRSGHMIVLSGFKVKQNSSQENKNFGTNLLGGDYGLSSNVELVVLIQPTLVK
ncbi:MAG: hypothetical protein PVI75_01055 [Gammaproteobacteria bacterium]|jgi:type IVB pilus formation R64 PilN family outer membrane protein